jgi:hypothetical protein
MTGSLAAGVPLPPMLTVRAAEILAAARAFEVVLQCFDKDDRPPDRSARHGLAQFIIDEKDPAQPIAWALQRFEGSEPPCSNAASGTVPEDKRPGARASDPKVESAFGISPMLTFCKQRIVRRGKPGPLFRTMR